ncbi:Sap190p [Sugiyamaella lignohabitans]|uniref:Sap190p n=1 Tax=Sugiyamaella lignohabitans TaxID=796027 RepID=A0A167F2N9_9ASCO|nr:Sap190p [Sugiyamaella lignohabitans]ANB14748.1 Sap190p [Sugiyamaella lignohabitans]
MLYGGSGLGTGVGVIIEIIRKNNSDYDLVPVLLITLESHPPGPRDPIYLGTLVKLFAESIPKFQAILAREHKEQFETPFGKIEPLGFERFKICELFAELLHCSNMSLLNDPAGEGIIKTRDEERERVKKIIARARGEIESVGQDDELVDELRTEKSVDSEDAEKDKDVELTEADESDKTELTDSVAASGLDKQEGATGKPAGGTDRAIEADIGGLSIKTDDEKLAGIANGLRSDDDESESGGGTDYQSAISEDDDSNEKGNNSALDLDEGDDLTLAQSLAQQEATIRKNPVVGDQLKIALADNKCITTILEMFFKFPWNNFLHNVVFDIVQQILNGPIQEGYNKFLAIDLFGEGRLTQVIYEGHAACEQHERDHKTRLGYMGHLTLISEEVVKFTALYTAESVSPVVAEAVSKPEWIHYVTHTLVRTREQYNTILGGKRPDGSEYGQNPNAIILGNGDDNDDNDGDVGSELGEEESPGGFHQRHDGNGGDDDDDEDDDMVSEHHRHGHNEFGYHDDDEDDEDDVSGHGGAGNASNGSRKVGGSNTGSGSVDIDGSGDQFARYMSQQISGTGHFGSSDEDDDDEEWENDRSDYRGAYSAGNNGGSRFDGATHSTPGAGGSTLSYGLSPSAEDEDDDEDDDLGLVRSRSYNDMN